MDKFLRKYLENAPLSFIYKAIRKDVKVNGKRGKEDTVLHFGDEILLYISDADMEKFQKRRRVNRTRRQFGIAYEDDNLLAAVKPLGLLTHGDSSEKKNHLANQVVDYLIDKEEFNPRLEKTFTPAPVNRLDRNTTGLVLFGKNAMSLQTLNQMVREKDKIRKMYLTVVGGRMEKPLHLMDRMVKNEEKNRIATDNRERQRNGNHRCAAAVWNLLRQRVHSGGGRNHYRQNAPNQSPSGSSRLSCAGRFQVRRQNDKCSSRQKIWTVLSAASCVQAEI